MAGKDPKSEKPDLSTRIPGSDEASKPAALPTMPTGTDWEVDNFNVSQGDKPKNPPPIPGGGNADDNGND
jgi:hypothetical protein